MFTNNNIKNIKTWNFYQIIIFQLRKTIVILYPTRHIHLSQESNGKETTGTLANFPIISREPKLGHKNFLPFTTSGKLFALRFYCHPEFGKHISWQYLFEKAYNV